MHSIETIADSAASGLAGISSHLPWGWFTVLAMVDLALVAVLVGRRLRGRAGPAALVVRRSRSEALILCDGWWVPRSRARALPSHPRTYAWPLHREYMVRRGV